MRRTRRDEMRLDLEEHSARVNRLTARFSVALVAVLAIAVAGLIIAVIALRHEVHTLANAASDNTVATSAIQDSAVTAAKLAAGAVGRAKLPPAVVGRVELARNSVAAPGWRRVHRRGPQFSA